MFYEFARFLVRIYYKFFFRLKVIGKENIPELGPLILCGNHIHNFDPITLALPLERQVHYMAKQEIFKIPILKTIVKKLGAFPVNRGSIDRNTLRKVYEVLDEKKVLGIFPEGTRNRTDQILLKGQSGVALFALKSKAKVIPVAIKGSYNIFSRLEIQYGEPIDLSSFYDKKITSELLEEVTELIMNKIKDLLIAM